MKKDMKEEEKVRNEHIRRGNRDSAPVKKTGPPQKVADDTTIATDNPAAFAKRIIDALNKYLEGINAHKKSCDQLDEKLKKVSYVDTSIIWVPNLHLISFKSISHILKLL